MRKEFFKPFRKGQNIFYCQAKYKYDNLFDSTNFVSEFEATTLDELKRQILDYGKCCGLTLIDIDKIYVVHCDTTYSTQGFSFKQEFLERGYIK